MIYPFRHTTQFNPPSIRKIHERWQKLESSSAVVGVRKIESVFIVRENSRTLERIRVSASY